MKVGTIISLRFNDGWHELKVLSRGLPKNLRCRNCGEPCTGENINGLKEPLCSWFCDNVTDYAIYGPAGKPPPPPPLDITFNPKTIEYKGKTTQVVDYEMFTLMIKGWINNKENPMTKDQALDLFFEMGI